MVQFIAQILQAIVFLTCLAFVMCCRGGTILDTGVTLQERAIILETHNKLRASVAMGRVPGQPEAENMREMVWDDELAARAQEWANQCTFKHDPHRTVDRFTMGQNMAIIWSTESLDDDGDFPTRIQNWFNEVKKYAFGAAWSPKTGHYSQLVWGETSLVGCGYTYFKDARKYNKLYVCNYGPGGNVVGYNPYEIGKPACSNHGMYPSSKYQGLCSVNGGSTGGSQQNAINTYYKTSSYNTYNTKTSYYQQPQQQEQQHQYQYQYQHQQNTQQEQQPNNNHDNGYKTFFKFFSNKPSGFHFRSSWGTQVHNHYSK